MPRIDRPALQAYLSQVLRRPVVCERVVPLGGVESGDDEKGYGYGVPLRVDYRAESQGGGDASSVVVHTMRPAPFGHEHRADRAALMLWSHDTFNRLPRHVRSIDVGGFTSDGRAVSCGDIDEFFLLTDFVAGEEYARDIHRMRETGRAEPIDHERADALCDYLVDIHRERSTQDNLYRRRIRELIGGGECIMGLIDSYPPDQPVFTPAVLQELERRLIDWRWRLRGRVHRLRQVHGDFHPWNILFDPNGSIHVLDRSRGEWGEPVDDVTSLTMNYLFESLQRHGRLAEPWGGLFERFWQRYLAATGDDELLAVAGPFFVFRGLVMASPVWFPHIEDPVRRRLLAFCRSVLDAEPFDPRRVNDYLDGK